MSNLQQFIEQVLAVRHSKLPNLDAIQKDLQELRVQISEAAGLAGVMAASVDAPPPLKKKAESVAAGVADVVSQIDESSAKAMNLSARFGKSTINIGVAGKSRQGKSTILQAISGLDGSVIPASGGLPCTGAKSRIFHREEDPHAMIEFYTKDEFLREIVHAYFEELGFGSPPMSMDQFEQTPLPSINDGEPEKHAIFAKLKELHDGLPDFKKYLSQPKLRTELSNVQAFVSQEDGRKRYHAVRCADIFAKFPQGDVVGLSLVDLPGLGEIAKGHSEKLVNSLQREVDAVVLVKRCAAGGDDWFALDIRVFNEVKKAIPEFDISDWLFVVLNDDNVNRESTRQLLTRPLNIGSKPKLIAVDCTNVEEVRAKVFLDLLNHLQMNLKRLDDQQAAVLTNQLAKLRDDAEALVEPIEAYFKQDKQGVGDFQKFTELAKDFCTRLKANLDRLTDEYRLSVGDSEITSDFRAAADEACNAANQDVPIPTTEELADAFHYRGGWKGVVSDELHHLRSELTHRLAGKLDVSLDELVEVVRKRIIKQLLSAPLDKLLPVNGDATNDAHNSLEELRSLLSVDDQPTLIAGIDYLKEFSFAYQSHFHHRVREAMNLLDPMALREEGDEDPVIALSPPRDSADHSDDVKNALTNQYKNTVFNVRKKLHSEMENDPMRAIFSMVEETRDRLARGRVVDQEWERLLYPLRGELWPSEFQRFAVESTQRNAWQNSVQAIRKLTTRITTAAV